MDALQSVATAARPSYPHAPQGCCRLRHRPTMRAALLYWAATERRCSKNGEVLQALVASGLRQSYAAALAGLDANGDIGPE